MPSFFCTGTDLCSRLSPQGVALRIDDFPNAIPNVLQDATNRCHTYLDSIYDPNDLLVNAQGGGWVNDRAVDLASYLLCRRRGNSPPAAVKEAYQEAMDELDRVHMDHLQIPNLRQRHTSYPSWSNIVVDPRYNFRKIRVEQSISENSPSTLPQTPDWRSISNFEY